jgi:hypothetical protein
VFWEQTGRWALAIATNLSVLIGDADTSSVAVLFATGEEPDSAGAVGDLIGRRPAQVGDS